jgi:hypothetical protein
VSAIVRAQPAITAMAAAMSEAQLQDAVMGLADILGLRAFHSTDSRRDTAAGFPDLVIVGSRVLFVELKRQDGRLRPEQGAWLGALNSAGADAVVWRPGHLLQGTIETTLRGMRA